MRRTRVSFFILVLLCSFCHYAVAGDLSRAERYSLLGLCNLAVSEVSVTNDTGLKLYAIYCLLGNGLVDSAYRVLDSIDDPETKEVARSLFREVKVTLTPAVKSPGVSEELMAIKDAFFTQDYDKLFSLIELLKDENLKKRYKALAYYRMGRWKEFLEVTKNTDDDVLLYYRAKVRKLLGLSYGEELGKLSKGDLNFYKLVVNWSKLSRCETLYGNGYNSDKSNDYANDFETKDCAYLMTLQLAGLDEKSKEYVIGCLEKNKDFIYRMRNPYYGIRALYVLKLSAKEIERYSFLRPENRYVRLHAHLFGVDEDLIYAIMRQESLFNRFARSFADARGLMQMIVPTANWIAENLGDSKSEHKLFIPFFSIRYGTWYLSHLSSKFNLPQVIVAYNKGPTRLKKWLSENAWANDAVDLAEFFPVEEAREYLKKVLVNYYYYRCKY